MSSRLPTISVILPVFNGSAFLERSVQSMRQQTFEEWELLAVDDGSTDASRSLLLEMARTDARIRVFGHSTNAGLSAARNTALGRARGSWVAYLDCDDEFYPDHLRRVFDWRERAEVLLFEYDIFEERIGHPSLGTEYRYETGRHVRRLGGDDSMPVPLGVAHRRALLDRVGLFDETLLALEDRDMWSRMGAAGATVAFVPAASGRYHVRSDSLARMVRAEDRRRPGPAAPPDIEVVYDRTPVFETAPQHRPMRPRASGPARVLFCSYHGYADGASGAACATRDLLESLAARGQGCGVLCGPDLDSNRTAPVGHILFKDGSGFRTDRVSLHSLEVRLHHVVLAGVPVTAFDPVERPTAPEPTPAEEAAFIQVLREVQGQFGADILLTYGGHRLARGVMAEGRRIGMKVVFWLHNLAYRDPGFFNAADAVLVPSEFAGEYYRRLGVDCVAIPGPVQADRVRCDRADRGFVTFVNPVPAKGVRLVAAVIRELADRRPDIPVLVVAGRGDVDGLARSGVDLSGVDTVHRMANTPDPRDFLRRTRVLLMPSLEEETFGRVAAEAVLNGIPVVASDRGALPGTVGRAGIVLPVPERLVHDHRAVPTEDEARPWADAVMRTWDEGLGLTPAELAEVCSRWSGDRAIASFGDWFDSLLGRDRTV